MLRNCLVTSQCWRGPARCRCLLCGVPTDAALASELAAAGAAAAEAVISGKPSSKGAAAAAAAELCRVAAWSAAEAPAGDTEAVLQQALLLAGRDGTAARKLAAQLT